MKQLLFCLSIASTLFLVACEKCYECTGELPIYTNGQQVGSTEDVRSFCDKGAKADANKQAYEGEGYTCVEKD